MFTGIDADFLKSYPSVIIGIMVIGAIFITSEIKLFHLKLFFLPHLYLEFLMNFRLVALFWQFLNQIPVVHGEMQKNRLNKELR